MNALNKRVGSALKDFRLSLKLRQREIAQKLGLTQAQWSSLELGKSGMGLDRIMYISQTFTVHPIALAGFLLDRARFEDVDRCLPLVYWKIIAQKVEEDRKEMLNVRVEDTKKGLLEKMKEIDPGFFTKNEQMLRGRIAYLEKEMIFWMKKYEELLAQVKAIQTE